MSSARRIVVGDCVERMAAMPECSVDAVVCDPPYHLRFMGRAWDHAPTPRESQAMHEAWAREALRVLKPGGHLLAFGGTRTYHRLACAVEDAGFEVRDTICWLYGSGFPKSLDVSKAIDKAAGAEREVVGRRSDGRYAGGFSEQARRAQGAVAHEFSAGWVGDPAEITAPATPDAERWQGWGTALKPAHEPIVVARKPLAGTVAGNVRAHGTGALNVDGCRIEHASADDLATSLSKNPGRSDTVTSGTYGADRPQQSVNVDGRWPANVVLDEEAAALLDEQSGERTSGLLAPHHQRTTARLGTNAYGDDPGDPMSASAGGTFGGDSGGASRFFYVAKASSAERNAGLDGFDPAFAPTMGNGIGGKEHDPETATPKRNVHPTVKPIELMRWLVRLVTPPGGTVLDPFAGSGTTGCAAALEGFRFIGIEREAEYAAIAEARIAWWEQHPEGVGIVKALEADRARQKVADSGQLGLL